ncbi:MAG: hypothetical protein M3O62_05075 [Pseudomonadota bacterium]|nr:hypothetical protein [Pseudomonadota bacterium]
MNGRRHALTGLLLAACSHAAVASYVPRAQVEAAARTAAVHAKQLGDESALVGALQQAQWRSVIDPLPNEAQMMSALEQLRSVTAPSPQTLEAVSALLDYSAQTLTDPIDVEQRRRQVPAFAIAGAARSALSHWQLRADVARLRTAAAQADSVTIANFDNEDAIGEVIRSAAPAELAALHRSAAPTPSTLHALFLRLADPQLALDALRQAPTAEGLDLITDIPRVLAPDAAFAVLSDAGIDPEYRSASRLALVPLLAQLPAARSFLLGTLADDSGDSSAVALGRSGDGAAIGALSDIVEREADSIRLRNALLGLRASAHPAARATLAQFVADERRAPALREEISAWLR